MHRFGEYIDSCGVSMCASMISSFIVTVSMELVIFILPIYFVPNHLLLSNFFIPNLGQNYLSVRLYSDLYVLMILNRWIFGLPASFGRSIKMKISHRDNGFLLRSTIVMMLWCSSYTISLKATLSSKYNTSSGAKREWL